MRGAIAVLSTVCKRFAAILRRCDVESFLNVGRLYPEIAPMEKRIDMHIDLLRREEFREMEFVSDISKYDMLYRAVAYDSASFQGYRPSLTILRRHSSKVSSMILENASLDLCYLWIMIWTCMHRPWA